MTVGQIARAPFGALARRLTARRPEAAIPEMNNTVAFIMGSTGLLLLGGLIMILSSSWVTAYRNYGSSFSFFLRQLLWAGVGVVALVVTSRIDYRRLRRAGYVILGVTIVGLLLVLHPALGARVSGSTRWLTFGPVRFQPSELAKLAMVLVGADICARKGGRLRTVKEALLPVGLVFGFIGLLIMMQPDLGTTLIVGGICFAVLYLAGTKMRVLGFLGGVGLVSATILAFSAGYRRARITRFWDPFSDAQASGYQAVQAQIALGSGGLFGVGLGASRQKWLYVPNAHTDFIFAIIGEELGLLGTLAVLSLFGVLIYAGIRTARRAPDAFGRIVAGAITAWIGGQAVINMGAVTGIMPITGVPLPLVSFGGSSLVFTLIGLGILINIARQEKWPPAPTQR